MIKILRYVRLIVPAIFAFFFAQDALAVACNSTGTGNWATIATWSCGHIPVAADTVTIATGNVVTLNSAAGTVTSLTVSGTLVVSSSLTVSGAASNVVAINGGKLQLLAGTAMSVVGGTPASNNIALNAITLSNSASSIFEMDGGTLTISGGLSSTATANAGTFTMTGGTITMATAPTANLTSDTFVLGSATIFNMSGGTIILRQGNAATNDANIVSTTQNVTGGTLQFGDASSVAGNPYLLTNTSGGAVNIWNLVAYSATSGNLQFGTTLNVLNSVTINTGATLLDNGAFAINIGGGNAGGSWNNSGTFTPATGTVTFTGTANDSIAGTTGTTFYKLVINAAAPATGVTLANATNTTVSNLLTLTNGAITTGANTLIVTPSCATPSVVRTNGYVIGNLRKTIPAGASSCTLEVGSGANYTPAVLAFAAGTTTGNITASTTGTDHPSIASSGIDSTNSVNRYWTLTNGGVGLPAAGYTATFNYINGSPVDLDAPATPANFIVEQWNGTSWFSTNLSGACTSTQCKITGETGFGDFAIGDPLPLVTPVPGLYNAFDTSTPAGAILGKIQTKVAGTGFSVDIVHINATKTGVSPVGIVVELRLLDSSGGGALDVNGCNAAWPLIQALPNFTIPASGRGTIPAVTVANSYRSVRFQIRSPAGGPYTQIGCSTDLFAIRPSGFTILVQDLNRTTAGTTNTLNTTTVAGTPVHNAGQPFRVQATAVNASAVTTTNYIGTPTIIMPLSACAGTACPTFLGTFSIGTWPAAVAGVTNSTTATYSEVGAFTLQLQDTSFASVDAVDLTPADCTGQWVCSSVDVGRFVPDHFAVSGGSLVNRSDLCPLGTGCPSAFTYMGEQMNAVFTLTAMNGAAIPATTQNYTYTATNNLAKLIPTAAVTPYTSGPLGLGVIDTAAPRTPFPVCTVAPAHPCFTPSAATAGSFASGVATGITVPLTVYRGAAAVGPFAALNIGVAPLDSDGVTTVYNLDTTHVVAGANDHTNLSLSVPGDLLYGRIKLSNAYGSELLQLPITVTAQYWNGLNYVTSITDSVSSFAATNVVFNPYQLNLTAGNYPNSGATSVTPASVVFINGVASYQLAKPGITGSVDMTTNAPTYLPSNTARATFGVYKGPSEFIYLHENY